MIIDHLIHIQVFIMPQLVKRLFHHTYYILKYGFFIISKHPLLTKDFNFKKTDIRIIIKQTFLPILAMPYSSGYKWN